MESVLLPLIFGLAIIFFIIAVNGYFVAQEFAYMSVNRIKLTAQAKGGDGAAEKALQVTQRTSFMLSGAQLGITVTGLLVGYVAEPLVGKTLGSLLGGVGVLSTVSISVGTIIALGFATVVQMIFGELYPKNLAIANPEPLAKALARSTLIYLSVFGWIIVVFDKSANAFLRILRIEPVHDVDVTATVEDLEHIVAESRASGHLPDELSIILDRVIDFPDQDVEHAMVHRSKVDTLTPDTSISEALTFMGSAHTRYPIVSENDEPLGVIQLYDLLSSPVPHSEPVTTLMVPPLILPTLMPLPAALEELSKSHNQLGCVVDEYGSFAGILTLEDLAEELVGEISDEHDVGVKNAHIQNVESGVWIVGGDVPLDEVERTLNCDLPAGNYETLAGLLLAVKGNLLHLGDVVSVDLPPVLGVDEPPAETLTSLVFNVLKVERNVPSEVRISAQFDAPQEGRGLGGEER